MASAILVNASTASVGVFPTALQALAVMTVVAEIAEIAIATSDVWTVGATSSDAVKSSVEWMAAVILVGSVAREEWAPPSVSA